MSAEQGPLMAAYARFRKRHTRHAGRCQCGRSLPCSELAAWEAALVATEGPRFMTADELAAEISGVHDVHVDCAHAAIEQIAKWQGVPADRLVASSETP
jgi:hypothetical protein